MDVCDVRSLVSTNVFRFTGLVRVIVTDSRFVFKE